MYPLNLDQLTEFVNQNIDLFHQGRLAKVKSIKLADILKRKNPYLFRAKNITSAGQLVQSILSAVLSSSEETLFGRFMEEVAIYVNAQVFNGQKSSSPGIDLDFTRDDIRFLVAIKSGKNWGNSSQQKALRRDFENAQRVLRQTSRRINTQTVLGICYGNDVAKDNGAFRTVWFSNFGSSFPVTRLST